VHKYTYKYSNYIYYHWVQQLSFVKGLFHSNRANSCRFPNLLAQHNLKYFPIDYTSTINVTLNWKLFATFYEEVESYAIERYPYLTYFLESWFSYKKHGFLPFVGFERTPPSVWRLGLGGTKLR